jgi:hypothetical protein
MDKTGPPGHLLRAYHRRRHRMISKSLLGAALASGLMALAGCAVQTEPAAMAVPPPIPATTIEVIPKPPVSAVPLIWQPGHWDWNGTGYVWTSGQYVPRDSHGNLYMPGWWARTPAGWQWQPSHWL